MGAETWCRWIVGCVRGEEVRDGVVWGFSMGLGHGVIGVVVGLG